jgi:RNA polymerase sigma-70 factor, ECF subfamily
LIAREDVRNFRREPGASAPQDSGCAPRDREEADVRNLSVGEDEVQLARAAKLGSTDALARLFDLHWPAVWQAAYVVTGRRDLANDVAQDTWLRAIERLPQFDESRPLVPWLTRIAVNRAIDVLRREKRVAGLDEKSDFAEDDDVERDFVLLEAVRRLDFDRRLVVVLHYWMGLQVQEIGELLGLPTGTVSSRLGRALRDLRLDLEARHV